MNALVKKEIRLLRPAWLIVLAPEVVLPWFGSDPNDALRMAPVFSFFGMILLAVDSFGREFSLGTFSSLMAQPMDRHHIWRTKTTVLGFAAALIFAAFFASCWLRFHLALAEAPPTWRNLVEIKAWRIGLINNFQQNMTISAVVMFVALAGGLWAALLFRQIAAAFWITFLAPAGLLMATLFFLPSGLAANDHVFTALLYSLAALYTAWGFWLAHRLFHRAQDAAWTGGVVSFSRWRYFESASKSSVSTRHRKPIAALIKKEFQLQSISWFCAAALLVLHLAVILMRYVHGSFERDSVASVTSEFFWAIWLVMPLIISSTAVAEERRLGVTEGQFCQPASRRLQFALKFFPAIFAGLLLGGGMPLLLEGIAAAIGAPNPDFKSFHDPDSGISPVAVLGLSLGLSLAAFYASTLTKSFMQAMGVAVITVIGCCLFTSIAGHLRSFLGVDWNPSLTIGISVMTALGMAPWLACRNFQHVQEQGRIWQQNAFSLTAAILFIFVASAALYNRAWEVFEPAEPAHGLAVFSLANPPTLCSSYELMRVRLPDGRVWFNDVEYSEPRGLKGLWMALVSPLPVSTGPQQFMAGSNWVSVTATRVDFVLEGKEANPSGDNHVTGYLDTIGIRKDGSLWISNPNHGKWTGDDMARFGNGTNWQQVVRAYAGVFLLKNDGTLWRWGTNHLDWGNWRLHWPSLQASQLYQVGTNSDWKELSPNLGGLAQKADGSVWAIRLEDNRLYCHLLHEADLDQVSLRTLSVANNQMAYVRKDGTLWFQCQYSRNGTNVNSGFSRVGTETNWTAVTLAWDNMVALKSNGSVWRWNLDYKHPFTETIQRLPTRLGIHSDWVAIDTSWANTIALAADGSLWLWPDRENYYPEPFLKLPKQPKFMGDVFGKIE